MLQRGKRQAHTGRGDPDRARADRLEVGAQGTADPDEERRVGDGELHRGRAGERPGRDRLIGEVEAAGSGDEAADVQTDRARHVEVGRLRQREAELRDRRPVEDRGRAGCLIDLHSQIGDVQRHTRDAQQIRRSHRQLEPGVGRQALLERDERQIHAGRRDAERARADGLEVGAQRAADPGEHARVGDNELDRGRAAVRCSREGLAGEVEAAGSGDEAADVQTDRARDVEVGRLGEAEAELRDRRPVDRSQRGPGRLVHFHREIRDVQRHARQTKQIRGCDRQLQPGVGGQALLERNERQADTGCADPKGPRADRLEVGAQGTANPDEERRVGDNELDRGRTTERGRRDRLFREVETAGSGHEAADVQTDRARHVEVGRLRQREAEPVDRPPVDRHRQRAAGRLVHVDREIRDVQRHARQAKQIRRGNVQLETGVGRQALLQRGERQADTGRRDPERARAHRLEVGAQRASDADEERCVGDDELHRRRSGERPRRNRLMREVERPGRRHEAADIDPDRSRHVEVGRLGKAEAKLRDRRPVERSHRGSRRPVHLHRQIRDVQRHAGNAEQICCPDCQLETGVARQAGRQRRECQIHAGRRDPRGARIDRLEVSAQRAANADEERCVGDDELHPGRAIERRCDERLSGEVEAAGRRHEAADIDPDRSRHVQVGRLGKAEAELRDRRPVERSHRGSRRPVHLHRQIRDVQRHAGNAEQIRRRHREVEARVGRQALLQQNEGQADTGRADPDRSRGDRLEVGCERAADTGEHARVGDDELHGSRAGERRRHEGLTREVETAGRGDEAANIETDRARHVEVGRLRQGETEPADCRPVERRRQRAAGRLVHLHVEIGDVQRHARDAEQIRSPDHQLETGVARQAGGQRRQRQTHARRRDPGRARA